MLGPNDMKKKYDMDELIQKIDESMKKFNGWYDWETAILDLELPVDVRNRLAVKYLQAGWTYVYHSTSSEDGERAGLTGFEFSCTHLEHPKDNSYLVMKSNVNDNGFAVYQNDRLISIISG